MESFFTDIVSHLDTYYNKIVDLTPKLLLGILVIVLVWTMATRVKLFALARLKKRMHDPLLATFLANLFRTLLIVLGVFFMLRIVGLNTMASSLLAGAGISAFIIGFALKDIGENFLAGILLAFKRPFTVGEIIETNGVKGKVISLNLRDTQIKSDGKDIYIPNALLIKNPLVNYSSGGYLLQEINVNLEYGADYQKAIDLIKGIVEHDADAEKLGYKSNVVLSGIAGAAPTLNVRYWVRPEGFVSDGQMRSRMLIKVLTVLKENEFVIKKE